MLKISVIIPMYNSEAFISSCLQSVLNQTYSDFEIIIVDDGSIDKGPQICGKFAAKDKRVLLLEQPHKGVSAARNRGLDTAAGEYVFFLDSDDAIHPKLFEAFAREIKIQASDILFCNYIKKTSLQMESILKKISPKDACGNWKAGNASETEEAFHMKHTKQLSCIGGKLISRTFIGGQRFDERLSYGEDTLFLYCLTGKRMTMAYLEKEWYYYRKHPLSLIHSREWPACQQELRILQFIKNSEYSKKNLIWALEWEKRFIWKLLTRYLIARNTYEETQSQQLEKRLTAEKKTALFRKLPVRKRMLFDCLFFGCLHFPFFRKLWILKQKSGE